MKFYKDQNNHVYAYESDGSQDKFIRPGLTPISEQEALDIANPPMSEQQMKEHEIAQDMQYLASTDYVVSKLAEAQAQGQDISAMLEQYASVLTERENARIRIRINRDAISNS